MLAVFSGRPQTPYTTASARTVRVSCRSRLRRCCLLGEEEDDDDEDVVEDESGRPVAACRASSATCRVRSWHASVKSSGRQKKQPNDHHMRASW